jgi:hypothetical protein
MHKYIFLAYLEVESVPGGQQGDLILLGFLIFDLCIVGFSLIS